MVCSELVLNGFCSKGDDCTASHFLKLCHLCNATLITQHAYDAHHAGKSHSTRLFQEGAGKDGICQICQVPYMPQGSATRGAFVAHCRGTKHLKKAARLPEFVPNVRHDININSIPPGSKVCQTCNTIIPSKAWGRHIKNRKHRNALSFHTTKTVQENVTQNRHAVEVAPGDEDGRIEFGVVDPDLSSVSLEVTVTLTAPSNVILRGLRLHSTLGKRGSLQAGRSPRQPHFIVPSDWRSELRLNEPLTLSISFHPEEILGRFDDRLEFICFDVELQQTFPITRTLSASVGDQAELAALQPVKPYVRPERRKREDRGKDIDGIRVPFVSDIKWVVKLAEFPVPVAVRNAINQGNVEEQVARVKETMIPKDLNPENYGRHWQTLLWLEEIQMAHDLENYDMKAQELVQQGSDFALTVPGLAEKRPSVILNDKIRVRPSGDRDVWWSGYVHRVGERQVQLRFNSRFNFFPGQRFDVQFTLGRSPLRRMHQGMSTAWNPGRILFPGPHDVMSVDGHAPTPDEIRGIRLFNKLLETNPPQKLAVASILTQPPGSVPFVIFGPPGTGKTVVAVEAMRQILDRDPSARILACAPSNSAADLLCDRLRQAGFVSKSEMFRLNAPTRPVQNLSRTLSDFSRKMGDAFVVPPVEELRLFRVVIATCVSSSLPHAIGVPRGHYTHIFIDEAGQALEPEAMISIRTMCGHQTNIVISGDPKQLGPIVRSKVGIPLGLGTSYLDRLMSREVYDLEKWKGVTVVKLIQNFRSHNDILSFPNQQFYAGELEARADMLLVNSLLRFERLVQPNFPVIFHAITGEDKREASSPSFFNPHEVSVIKQYVQALREDQRLRLLDSDIGIISPYNAQNRKIRQVVNDPILKKSRPGVLKVGSVEEFQGQERRAILVSTVRSNQNFIEFDINHTLGFVANPRRFNVAMTRAQALLIVVGDPKVLSLDPMWRSFLDYIHRKGGWRGTPKDWDDDDGNTPPAERDLLEERRQEHRSTMDDMTRLMQEIVLDHAPGASTEDADGFEGAEDRPWREDE